MNITIAQLNPTVGAVNENLKAAIQCIEADNGADLIVFSEMFLVGYPAMDILERPGVLANVNAALNSLKDYSKSCPNTAIAIGAPRYVMDSGHISLYNTVFVIQNGAIVHYQDKLLLPSYDVFYDSRHFVRGAGTTVWDYKGQQICFLVCEDAWMSNRYTELDRYYEYCPINVAKELGATLVINVSASPFELSKRERRLALFRSHIQDTGVPYIFTNQVGANDDLIYDGQSMVLDAKGRLIQLLPAFQESVQTVALACAQVPLDEPIPNDLKDVHDALVLGIRDYFKKTGVEKAVVGLSGGIDSAVTAALAVRALGSENVRGITMPSQFSSDGSIRDSQKLAEQLGISIEEISIRDIHNTYSHLFKTLFSEEDHSLTNENIQARIRGDILMAVSNQTGALLLTTGNKSELAVGYCTLYGDMCGALSVLADVFKTMVYQLASYINTDHEIIPKSTILKRPSAELRPDQCDQDTLPPYDILDSILRLYIMDQKPLKEIVQMGYDEEIVAWVIKRVQQNEYKRRQAAPCLRVSKKAFGMGRRYMLAQSIDEGA